MDKSKQLPFALPPFCTYQYLASSGVAAMQNPTAYNWYLSHCMILSCSKRFLNGYTSLALGINDALLSDLYFLEHIDVKRSFVDGCELQVIKNMIDDGYYVCFNMVDVFYIDGMLWSGENHNLHDGMICGYDETDHTLTLAAYDSRWIYRSFTTSQEGFLHALASGKEKGGYDGFIGIKPKDDKIPLDLACITELLKKYLTPDPYGNCFEESDSVHGITVHDYIRLYLTFLLEDEIPFERMDRRIMRLLWEQKKCMADRIVAVEKRFDCSPDLSGRYAPVLQSAVLARSLYASYRIKRREDLLQVIINEIKKMKAAEEEILPEYINLIKEKMPNVVELSEVKNE